MYLITVYYCYSSECKHYLEILKLLVLKVYLLKPTENNLLKKNGKVIF